MPAEFWAEAVTTVLFTVPVLCFLGPRAKLVIRAP